MEAVPRPSDADLSQRCWDFENDTGEAIAERIEPVGEGITAYLDARIPLVWDANYLVIESDRVSAERAAAKADEVLGGEGMRHRHVITRDLAHGHELAPDFEKLGWEIERGVYMVLRREPDRPADVDVDVERISFEQAAELRRELLVEDTDVADGAVAEQMLELDRMVGEVMRDRWFAARHRGEPAGSCRLMQRDGIGQVEDVATLEAARNRGLARAVVLAAAQTSVHDADELTFLGADAEDWPQKLYQRLGFDPVGGWIAFRIKPPN